MVKSYGMEAISLWPNKKRVALSIGWDSVSIALSYGWDPVKMPSLCACNQNLTVAHALNCPKWWYEHMRHNELRDSFANLLSDDCHDVEIEPHLQPLQGETFAIKSATIDDDDARLDIKANEFWESGFNKT